MVADQHYSFQGKVEGESEENDVELAVTTATYVYREATKEIICRTVVKTGNFKRFRSSHVCYVEGKDYAERWLMMQLSEGDL